MAGQPTTKRLPRTGVGVMTLAIALVPLAPAPAVAVPAYCGTATAGPGRESPRSMERGTLRRLNRIRRRHHLGALRANDKLRVAARSHARDMLRDRYFAHDSPGGRVWSADIRDSGYLAGHDSWSIGQNIAWGRYQCGSPRSIVMLWMHSPKHRQVILTKRFKDVGIAVLPGSPIPVEGPAATYVANFGVRR